MFGLKINFITITNRNIGMSSSLSCSFKRVMYHHSYKEVNKLLHCVTLQRLPPKTQRLRVNYRFVCLDSQKHEQLSGIKMTSPKEKDAMLIVDWEKKSPAEVSFVVWEWNTWDGILRESYIPHGSKDFHSALGSPMLWPLYIGSILKHCQGTGGR